jgi:hypothetical protein
MPYKQTIKNYIKKRRKREKGERGKGSRLCSLPLVTLVLYFLLLPLYSICIDICPLQCPPVPFLVADDVGIAGKRIE